MVVHCLTAVLHTLCPASRPGIRPLPVGPVAKVAFDAQTNLAHSDAVVGVVVVVAGVVFALPVVVNALRPVDAFVGLLHTAASIPVVSVAVAAVPGIGVSVGTHLRRREEYDQQQTRRSIARAGEKIHIQPKIEGDAVPGEACPGGGPMVGAVAGGSCRATVNICAVSSGSAGWCRCNGCIAWVRR